MRLLILLTRLDNHIMIKDTSELYRCYDDLNIRNKTRLLKSGSDIIEAAYSIEQDLAISRELQKYGDSTTWEVSQGFMALESLYDASYEHSREETIVWDIEKLRSEETLEELDEMLSPNVEGF